MSIARSCVVGFNFVAVLRTQLILELWKPFFMRYSCRLKRIAGFRSFSSNLLLPPFQTNKLTQNVLQYGTNQVLPPVHNKCCGFSSYYRQEGVQCCKYLVWTSVLKGFFFHVDNMFQTYYIALLSCRFLSLSFDLHASCQVFWHLLLCPFSTNCLKRQALVYLHPSNLFIYVPICFDFLARKCVPLGFW
jgi:hypothetical protein